MGPPPATAAGNTKGGGGGTDHRRPTAGLKIGRVFGFVPAQADLGIAREVCRLRFLTFIYLYLYLFVFVVVWTLEGLLVGIN